MGASAISHESPLTASAGKSGKFWPLAVWTLIYVGLGHLGVHYASFPGSWLMLIWLPSGIGVCMGCLYGRRALGWILLGSLLVNGPYTLIDAGRVGWPATLLSIPLTLLADTLQAWLTCRLLQPLNLFGQVWNRQTLPSFLVATLVGPLLTCWALVLMFYGFGHAPLPAGPAGWSLLSREYVMLTLGDAQGIFLIVPLVAAVMLTLKRRESLPWAGLAAVWVLPGVMLLGRIQPVLTALAFPLMAMLIGRTRFLGAAASVAVLGSTIAMLIPAGLSPLPLGNGMTAFSQWTLLLLSLGTPLLLLGILLEENHVYNAELEKRVAERTLELTIANQQARQATEQALAGSRAKSEFLANMSHEIRTPLNAVLGFTELLSRSLTQEPQLSYLRAVKKGGHALLTLINDILDLSKIEAGRLDLQYAPVMPAELLAEILEIFSQKAAEKDLTLQLEIPPQLPACLLLDEVRLRQVLFNLVGNALKFTEQGKVCLSAASQAREDGRVDLVLRVSDTGIGIPAEARESIFEAFRQQEGQATKKYGGTGLGLTITRKLVSMMNGDVQFESTLGEGSVFSVHLRAVEIAVGEPPSRQPESPAWRFAPAKVLIADDQPLNRQLLVELFKTLPFEIVQAENGQEAVERARQERPQLILLDVRMPIMDGFAAARALKADPLTREIPLFALTASVMQHEVSQLAAAGFDLYLRKPLTLSVLLQNLIVVLPHCPAELPDLPSEVAVPAASLLHRLPELIRQLEDEPRLLCEQGLEQADRATLELFIATLQHLLETFPLPALAVYLARLEQAAAGSPSQLGRLSGAFSQLLEALKGLNLLPALSEGCRRSF